MLLPAPISTLFPYTTLFRSPVKPEGDKVMRMLAQTAAIEAGSVLLPKRASWLQDFKAELMAFPRSEEHTSELQSQSKLVCRLLLEKKNSPAVDAFIESAMIT